MNAKQLNLFANNYLFRRKNTRTKNKKLKKKKIKKPRQPNVVVDIPLSHRRGRINVSFFE